VKVAVFGDVHGNLIALERFIAATRNAVDAYVCLGDVVNYGPWNDECLEAVYSLPGVTLLEGNHERLFLGTENLDNELSIVQDFSRHSLQSFSRRDLIAALPHKIALGDFECVHTIQGVTIYRDTHLSIDRNHIVGHSHHQFRIERSGFRIVNPGSVGQNRRWIDMLDYAVFDTQNNEMQMHSVPYNFNLFLRDLRTRRYPEQCISYYASKPKRAA